MKTIEEQVVTGVLNEVCLYFDFGAGRVES